MHGPEETEFAQVLHRWSGTAWRKCDADRAAQCAQGPDALRIRAQRTIQRSRRFLDPSTNRVGSLREIYGHAVTILRQSRRLYGCGPLKGAFSQPFESKSNRKSKNAEMQNQGILQELSNLDGFPGRALSITHKFSTHDDTQLNVDKTR